MTIEYEKSENLYSLSKPYRLRMQLVDYHTCDQSPRAWSSEERFLPLSPYSEERIRDFAIDILFASKIKDPRVVHERLLSAELVEIPWKLNRTDFARFLRTRESQSGLHACKLFFHTCRVFGHKLQEYSQIVGGVHSFFGLEELAYSSAPEINMLLQRKSEMLQSFAAPLPIVEGKLKCKEPLQRLSTFGAEYEVAVLSLGKKKIATFNGYKIATLNVEITKKRGSITKVHIKIVDWHEAPFSDIYWTNRLLRQKLETFFELA